MNKLFVTIGMFLLLAVSQGYAQNVSDSIFIERELSKAPQGAGTLYFSNLFIGRPYVAHTLEVNDEELLVVNTRELDCTTLVENVVALTICNLQQKTKFADFKKVLQQLRYRSGVISKYPSRLHYFTDWIVDNTKMGFVNEIQQTEKPFTAVQKVKVNFMSQHPQSYKALKAHPAFISVIAKQEQQLSGMTFRYIPKSEIQNTSLLRAVIHDGDILAITTSKAGLDIAHLGFAVWRKDGLHLLNASQLHHKVVEEPMTFRQYLNQHPSHTGVRVIRLSE